MGEEDPLEKEMATHSSKLHGQRNLLGYSPWSGKTVGNNCATKQQLYIYVNIYMEREIEGLESQEINFLICGQIIFDMVPIGKE